MKTINYNISQDIFNLFPEYVRGLVVIHGVENSQTDSKPFELFTHEIAKIRQELNSENLKENPNVAAWRATFKKAGITSQFRPSFEALLRRAINKPDGFRSISSLVDLGNYFSVKYRLPIGVHEIREYMSDLSLCLAAGDEDFIEFGKDVTVNPNAGEIVFKEGESVMTRRWIWRQGKNSIITPDTSSIFINIDVLPPVTSDQLRKILEEIADVFVDHCGGKATIHKLSSTQNSLTIDTEG